MAERDPWDPEESDNRLAYFRGRVVRDYYSTARQESGGKSVFDGADKPQRYWEVEILDVFQDWDQEVPATVTVNFGLGKDWYKKEDGSVRHKDDTSEEGSRTPDVKSGFGQFLGLVSGKRNEWKARRVVVLDGGPEEVEYNLRPVRQYFRDQEVENPMTPGIFAGCIFDFRGLGLVYNEGDEARSKALPTAFLGADGEMRASQPGLSSMASEVSVEEVQSIMAEDGAEFHEDLAKLLSTSDNKAQFQRNALQLLDDRSDLHGYVMEDDGLWTLK